MEWRTRVAHAATPWHWRSRRSVLALVGLAAVAGAATTLVVAVAAEGRRSALVGAATNAVIWALAAVGPSWRSLRRWDAAHAAPPPSS